MKMKNIFVIAFALKNIIKSLILIDKILNEIKKLIKKMEYFSYQNGFEVNNEN